MAKPELKSIKAASKFEERNPLISRDVNGRPVHSETAEAVRNVLEFLAEADFEAVGAAGDVEDGFRTILECYKNALESIVQEGEARRG